MQIVIIYKDLYFESITPQLKIMQNEPLTILTNHVSLTNISNCTLNFQENSMAYS